MELLDKISSHDAVAEEQFESVYDSLIEEGKVAGIAKGKIEGKAEGKAEGIVEGKIAGKTEAHIETIKNGTAIGLSPETLAQLTGLSIQQVRAIISL